MCAREATWSLATMPWFSALSPGARLGHPAQGYLVPPAGWDLGLPTTAQDKGSELVFQVVGGFSTPWNSFIHTNVS